MTRVSLGHGDFKNVGILLESNRQGRYDGGEIIRESEDQPWLPRSFATNGSRWLLFLHVALHVLAISFLVVGADESSKFLKLESARVLGISSVVSYVFGFLGMLLVAARQEFPTDSVFMNTLTLLGLLVGVTGTTVLFALSIRAEFEPDHYWLAAALFCELAALSLMVSCIINLSARGGRSHTAPSKLAGNKPRRESIEIGA